MIGVMARKKGEGELTAAERARIRKRGPAPSLSKTKKEWEAIIFQRIAEIESGAVECIPADVAIKRIRAKLRRLHGGR